MDIGNTNINIGLFSLQTKGKLINSFSLTTKTNITADEMAIFIISILKNSSIEPSNIHYIVCSSVVPRLNGCIKSMSSKYFSGNIIFISSKMNTGLVFNYPNPDEIGADRIVNAVAVSNIYGGPAIIVDFGTAITFCALSKNKEYLGGLISTGITTSLEALILKTSKLPYISLKKPSSILANTTKDGMTSGIYFGTIYMLEGIISHIRRNPKLKSAKVIATGGDLHLIADTNIIDIIDYNLTLKGLELLFYKNHN